MVRILGYWGPNFSEILHLPRPSKATHTFAYDPERAVGPAQTRSRQGLPLVVNGVSCWVRSKMGEVGPGGTSDIVKVMSVDPLSPV